MTRSKVAVAYALADKAEKIFPEKSTTADSFIARKTSWNARGIRGRSSMTKILLRGVGFWLITEGMVKEVKDDTAMVVRAPYYLQIY